MTAVELLRPSAPARPLRAVVYTRVSNDAAGGRSIAEQEKECRAILARLGWVLVHVYSDNDRSASRHSKDKRPDWEELMAALGAGRADALVIWEPSRATRDREVWARLAAICIERDVLINASGNIYRPSAPSEMLMLDIFFAFAAHEVAQTKARVDRAVQSGLELGKPAPGKAAFGYRRTLNGVTRRIDKQLPDTVWRSSTGSDGVTHRWNPADEARRIFTQLYVGVTAHSIAQDFNKRGIPNPRTLHASERFPDRKRKYGGTWSPNVVRNIARNWTYLGSRHHLGNITGNDLWEPLVDSDVFYAVQNAFTARRNGKGGRPAANRHLLTGIAVCSECGKTVQFTNQTGDTAYRCLWGHTFIPKTAAEAEVLWYLMAWLAESENLRQLRAASGAAKEVREARAEVDAILADLVQWEASAVKKEISLKSYLEYKASRAAELEDAERRARTFGVPSVLHPLLESSDHLTAWLDMPLSAQREVITFLFDVCILRTGRVGRKHIPTEERISVTRKPLELKS